MSNDDIMSFLSGWHCVMLRLGVMKKSPLLYSNVFVSYYVWVIFQVSRPDNLTRLINDRCQRVLSTVRGTAQNKNYSLHFVHYKHPPSFTPVGGSQIKSHLNCPH